MSEHEEQQEHEEETFLDQNEVGEVIEETQDGHIPEEDDEDDGMEEYEVDLSNNSSSYFDKHEESIFLVASHPTLPLVVTGGGDNKAYLWTTHNNPPTLVTELTGALESVIAGGFTSDGKWLIIGDMAGQLRIWRSSKSGERWEFYTSIQQVEEIVWISIHPKQSVFAVGAQDGSVWVYGESTKFSNIAVLYSHSQPTNDGLWVNIDADDELNLVTLSEDSTIICWNVYQSQAIYKLGRSELQGEHPWVTATLSPSGNTFAAGAQDGVFVIIKTDNGTVLQNIDTGSDSSDPDVRSIEGLAWSDSTNLLAVGNVDGEIKLYHVANWKVRTVLKVEDSVTKLVFAPGTRHLFSSSMDGAVVAWDVLSGQKLWEAKGHNAGVLGFATQNNFRRVITAGDEAVSLVFNIE